MYQKLGYTIYRTVLQYYSGDPDEDAYGKKSDLKAFLIKEWDEQQLAL